MLGTAKPGGQTLTNAVVAPTFTFGATVSNPNDKMGAALTDVIVNSSGFGFGVQLGGLPGHDHSFLFQNSEVSMIVYYETSGTNGSEFLQATNFGFTLAHNPIGLQVKFLAEVTSPTPDALMTAQLILSGSPIGSPKTVIPGGSLSTITLGADDDLWGAAIAIANANNATFGVEFQVSGGGTWSVGFVQMIFTTSVDQLFSGSCSLPDSRSAYGLGSKCVRWQHNMD